MLEVKIKKLEDNAVIPSYAGEHEAGMDLTAISINNKLPQYIEYGTGLSVEIPEGYVGLLFPRSSVSKYDMMLANSVGVIDSTYRGEIMVRMRAIGSTRYDVYDKVAQLIIIPYPKVVFKEVSELSDSYRGSGGFGSTDG